MATLQFPVGISQCILSMGIAHLEPSWNFSVTQGKVTLNLSWDHVNTGQICPGPPPCMKPLQVHCPKPQSYGQIYSRNRNYTAPRFNKSKTLCRSDHDVQWRNNSNNSENDVVSGFPNYNSHTDSPVSATIDTTEAKALTDDKNTLAGSDTQGKGHPDSAEAYVINGEITTLVTDIPDNHSNNNLQHNANNISLSHDSDSIDHEHPARYDNKIDDDDVDDAGDADVDNNEDGDDEDDDGNIFSDIQRVLL